MVWHNVTPASLKKPRNSRNLPHYNGGKNCDLLSAHFKTRKLRETKYCLLKPPRLIQFNKWARRL